MVIEVKKMKTIKLKKFQKVHIFFEFHYIKEAPKEILFLDNYKGTIELDFLGMTENLKIEYFKENINLLMILFILLRESLPKKIVIKFRKN